MKNLSRKSAYSDEKKILLRKRPVIIIGIAMFGFGLLYHLFFGGSSALAVFGLGITILHIFFFGWVAVFLKKHWGNKLDKLFMKGLSSPPFDEKSLLPPVEKDLHIMYFHGKKKKWKRGILGGVMAALHGEPYGNVPKTEGEIIRWARFYDIVVKIFFAGKEQAAREQTVELAQIKQGDRILDVGCGTGNLTLVAKTSTGNDGEVFGIDAAPEMIQVASQKASDKGLDVVFQVALIESIPFPDDSFDVILSSLMIHHLPDDLKRKGIAEMRRVLKPGGKVVIVDFEPPTGLLSKRIATLITGYDMMKSNLEALLPMIKNAGFTEIKSGRTQYKMLSFTQARL